MCVRITDNNIIIVCLSLRYAHARRKLFGARFVDIAHHTVRAAYDATCARYFSWVHETRWSINNDGELTAKRAAFGRPGNSATFATAPNRTGNRRCDNAAVRRLSLLCIIHGNVSRV